MVAQVPARFDIQTIATPTVYLHIVTLKNHRTEDEVSFQVETTSDKYTVVSREIAHQKVMRGLLGYAVYEVLDLNDPF